MSSGAKQKCTNPKNNAQTKLQRHGFGFEKTKKKTGLMIFHGDEIQLIKLKGFQSKNVLKSANRLLRNTIAFHLDGKILKTRKVLEELRKYDK